MSFESLFEDEKVLDVLFARPPKVAAWKFDNMKVDLSGLQMAALKRIHSRRESFREAAKHLGISIRDLRYVLRTAKQKLRRYRKELKARRKNMSNENQDQQND